MSAPSLCECGTFAGCGGSPGLSVLELPDSGDDRGGSFPVPGTWFDPPFPVHDTHISTVLPGQVRGDHYHVERHEVLIMPPGPNWTLFFDEGPGTASEQRLFTGDVAVMVFIPPLVSHAIRNEGDTPLCMVGLSDGPYDPAAPDAVARKVSSP